MATIAVMSPTEKLGEALRRPLPLVPHLDSR
jgi:hypothetical protein